MNEEEGVPSPENREALQGEWGRLKFDLPEGEAELVKFDPMDGRTFENGSVDQLESSIKYKSGIAVLNLERAMGIESMANFDPHTGAELPKEKKERLKALRTLAGEKVLIAREKEGLAVPKFDSETGEAIPQDSLKALIEVGKLRRGSLIDDEMADVKIGLTALDELKKMKLRREKYRKDLGSENS